VKIKRPPNLSERIPIPDVSPSTTQERRGAMKQPHTEQTVKHTGGEQNTGNHKKKGAPDEKGADRFGGTRAGAKNVEHLQRRAPR
jgi:hypothetical protein